MAKNLFRISTSESVNVLELTLPSVIDGADFDNLNESVLDAIQAAAAQPWVLDLSGVLYVGSAMLGMMINVRQRIKEAEGRLVLCGLSARLNEIFHACCMERLFTITRSRADALKAVAR